MSNTQANTMTLESINSKMNKILFGNTTDLPVKQESGLNYFHLPSHPYMPINRRRQSLFASKNAFLAGDHIWQRQSYHGPQLFQTRGGYGRLKLLHHHYSNQGLNVLSESNEGLFSSKTLDTSNPKPVSFAISQSAPTSSLFLKSPHHLQFTTPSTNSTSLLLPNTIDFKLDSPSSQDIGLISPSSTITESYFHPKHIIDGGGDRKRYINRIFVGNLSFRVTPSELRNLFEKYGLIVDIAIIHDRYGLSKGYGLVTFHSTSDVANLMDNHKDSLFLDGRQLRVQMAEERTIDEKRYKKRD